MENESNNRVKWLHVRLTTEEEEAIKKQFRTTTEKKLSDYIRRLILGKPMYKAVRDQSLQDILTTLLSLKKDLGGAANNLNQAVKKLHSLKTNDGIAQWLPGFRLKQQELVRSIAELNAYLAKTAEKWLQK